MVEYLARLPRDLLTVYRIMERWPVKQGSGLPWTDEDHQRHGDLARIASEQSDTFSEPPTKPPALNDATQTVIDQIVQHMYRQFHFTGRLVRADRCECLIHEFWCQEVPLSIMAKKRGLSEEGILLEMRAVLGMLRADFLCSADEDLITLVHTLP